MKNVGLELDLGTMGDKVSIIEGYTDKLESLHTAVAKKMQETSRETAFEVAQFIFENLLSSLFCLLVC
jgi:hypothetical protein